MTLHRANEILKEKGIKWSNYFDLIGINTKDNKLIQAIERVKTFITIGK